MDSSIIDTRHLQHPITGKGPIVPYGIHVNGSGMVYFRRRYPCIHQFKKPLILVSVILGGNYKTMGNLRVICGVDINCHPPWAGYWDIIEGRFIGLNKHPSI